LEAVPVPVQRLHLHLVRFSLAAFARVALQGNLRACEALAVADSSLSRGYETTLTTETFQTVLARGLAEQFIMSFTGFLNL